MKNKLLFTLVFLLIMINISFVQAEKMNIKYQADENYPPFSYSQDGKLLGIDYELASMIFSQSIYEVDYSSDEYSRVYENLVNASIDMAGLIVVEEENKKDILYTDPVLESHLAIFTRKDGPDFKLKELKNYKVGVSRGLYAEKLLTQKLGVSYYYRYDTVEKALIDLEKGRLDAVFGNQETINFLIVKNGFQNDIIPKIPNLYPFNFAFAVNKNMPELHTYINNSLNAIKKSGAFELLHQKYFFSYSSDYYKKQKDNFITIVLLLIVSFIAIMYFIRIYIKLLERRIKSSDKEVMLQKAYFRRLFENSPQATVILDLDDNITDANIGFEKMFGYKLEDIKGKKLSSLIMLEGEESEGVKVNKKILTNQIFQNEVQRKTANGRVIDVSLLGLPIINEGESIGVYGIYTDISDKKRQEDLVKRHAYFDCLTDLPNRHYLMEQLDLEIENARLRNTAISMLFIDLDDFKDVNDNFGHSAGDELLIEVGCRLREAIREGDIAARMGGDEFIVMIRDVNNKGIVYKIVKRIQESINNPYLIDNNTLKITASIGIAFYPDDGEDAETLLKNSDAAMYVAKVEGKNNYKEYKE